LPNSAFYQSCSNPPNFVDRLVQIFLHAIDRIVWTYCAFLSHNDLVSPSSMRRLYMEQTPSGRTVFFLCSVSPVFFAKSRFFYFFQLAFSLRTLTHRRASKSDFIMRALPNLFSHPWVSCRSYNSAFALTQALVAVPKVLILDQPLSNLDAMLSGKMWMEIKTHRARTRNCRR